MAVEKWAVLAGGLWIAFVAGCNGPSGGGGGSKISQPASTAAPTTGAVTATPQGSLAVATGAASPAAQTVPLGATRATVLQVHLGAVGAVRVTQLAVRESGSVLPTDVALVELALDASHQGTFTPGVDAILGAAAFSATGVATFGSSALAGLPPSGGSTDLLVLVSFGASGKTGATIGVGVAAADVTVEDAATGKALSATGSASGATVTIGAGSPPIVSASSWVAKASMPTPRMKMTAAVSDTGKIYVLGGRTYNGSLPTNEVYDPATNAWATKAPLHVSRILFGAAFHSGKIYAVGGSTTGTDVTGSLEIYDEATDTWTSAPPLPTPRRDLSAVVFGGLVYAIGGTTGSGAPFMGCEIYDPAQSTWTAGPTSTTSLTAPAAVANGFIVLPGGSQLLWGPALGTFVDTTGGNLAFPGSSGAAAAGTKVYVVGGLGSSSLPTGSVEIVDATVLGAPTQQTGSPLGTARRNLAVATGTNGKIYAFGGFDGAAALAVVEELTP